MTQAPDYDMNRRNRGLVAIGRLKPQVGLLQAQTEMDAIAAQLREYPDAVADEEIKVVPIDEDLAGVASRMGKPRALVIALGLAASVLLIACLHVASLLIARSVTREQEVAVRAALVRAPFSAWCGRC